MQATLAKRKQNTKSVITQVKKRQLGLLFNKKFVH